MKFLGFLRLRVFGLEALVHCITNIGFVECVIPLAHSSLKATSWFCNIQYVFDIRALPIKHALFYFVLFSDAPGFVQCYSRPWFL